MLRWQSLAIPGAAAARGETPLHFAAKQGQEAVVRELLAANAPLHSKNKDGRGP